MLIPLIFPGFEVFYNLSSKTTGNTFSTSTHLIFIGLSLLVAYLKRKELNFIQLNEKRTNKEFENAVLATANKLSWNIINFNDSLVEANAFNTWKSRDPQRITIVRKANKVLINSMFEPGFPSVPDLWGINKKNELTFLHYYQQSNNDKKLNERVIQNLKDEEDRIENEPEWSPKNSLKRIIAYIFSLSFLALGITIWKEDGFNLVVVLFGIIGSVYVIFDLYVMWKKMKAVE